MNLNPSAGPTAAYTQDQLRQMLLAGGPGKGAAAAAAAHILANAPVDLCTAYQVGHLQVVARPDGVDGHQWVANVAAWGQLWMAADHGAARSMVEIARSFAGERDCKLGEVLQDLPAAAAKVITEAVLIATGMSNWLILTSTPLCPAEIRETL